MSPSSPFFDNYWDARRRFRHAAELRGARQQQFPLNIGADDAELGIDVAVIGSERPAQVVLVTSGLHRIEGFYGSAVQVRFLEDEHCVERFLPTCLWHLCMS
jgi:hypothetical protein